MAAMSDWVRAGDLVFISGQVAFDEQGDVVGREDPEAQARQIFDNMQRCLAAEGASLEHLVRLTTYIVAESVFPAYSRVKTELFRDMRAPASTTVVVTALLHPDLLLEVDAIAYLAS